MPDPPKETGTSTEGDAADLYLELLKGALTHSIYPGTDAVGPPSSNPAIRFVMHRLARRGMVPVRVLPDAEANREEGRDWPLFGQTMVGHKRLDNLRACIESVVGDEVPGDIIETGVWRGGASIFARGVLKVKGVTDRKVWLADSFQGLPKPDAGRYEADRGAHWHRAEHLAVSRADVEENFRRYGLLDDQVEFLEGWFKDTLPTVADRTWSIVRLDGDMYESTMNGLDNLYDGLSPGGFLIVDDYSIEACRKAVADFRESRGIEEPIEQIDWTGIFWRKSG